MFRLLSRPFRSLINLSHLSFFTAANHCNRHRTNPCGDQILIKNFQNEVTKKLPPPNPSTDGMFFAGTSGRLLLSSEDRMTLFDTQSRLTLAELQVPRIKYVVWSGDYNYVALLSKHGTRF